MKLCAAIFLMSMPLASIPGTFETNMLYVANDVANALIRGVKHPAKFSLKAKVSYLKGAPPNRLIALSDETGSIVANFDPDPASYIPHPGDEISCTGLISLSFSTWLCAKVLHTSLISQHPTTEPLSSTIPELLNGKHDYQYIRTSGYVYEARRSETAPEWALLSVVDKGCVIYVSVLTESDSNIDYKKIIGTSIEVDGLCIPRELGYRIYLNRTIKTHGFSSIKPVRSRCDFNKTIPDIAELANSTAADIPRYNRYHAVGTVIATWNNYVLMTTTNSMTVRVTLLGNKSPHLGEFIDVTGFPTTDLFNINLINATWREFKGKMQMPSPQTSIQMMPSMHLAMKTQSLLHGKAIRTTGVVIETPKQGDEQTPMVIRNSDLIIPVFVNTQWQVISSITPGCQVDVSGICVLDAEQWHPNSIYPRTNGFIIVPRNAKDIVITARPPWWTIQRLLMLICALFIVLTGFIIWNTSLRRITTRKSRELFKEQLSHVSATLRTEERTRLAVEIHDTLSQNLTGVSMEIEAANDLRGEAPQSMLDHLDIAAKALKSCRIELRNCLWDLRSQALEEKDMTKAILRTLQPQANSAKLSVRFNVPRSKLSDNTTHSLLRAIRELVTNAIRHGKATSIKIAGALDENQLLCSVTDNGCGFDPDDSPGVLQGHFGLQGIQERIEGIDGTFTITSEIGKGTRALISLPIPKEVNPTQSPAVRKNTDSHNN